ncbi:hypothetical protein [Martelella sp. HB161492]|nr:hypothetical protein [Martelella sp. HB161492]
METQVSVSAQNPTGWKNTNRAGFETFHRAEAAMAQPPQVLS